MPNRSGYMRNVSRTRAKLSKQCRENISAQWKNELENTLPPHCRIVTHFQNAWEGTVKNSNGKNNRLSEQSRYTKNESSIWGQIIFFFGLLLFRKQPSFSLEMINGEFCSLWLISVLCGANIKEIRMCWVLTVSLRQEASESLMFTFLRSFKEFCKKKCER